MARKIGLIAGWGELPLVIAQSIRDQGDEVYCVGLWGHADERLKKICHGFRWGAVSRTRCHMRFFHKHDVRVGTMAGKVFKAIMLQKNYMIRYFPDLTFMRFFFPSLFARRQDRRDDTLLLAAVRMYEHHGVRLLPATDLAPQILAQPGPLSSRQPNARQWSDIRFGWGLAKRMGDLDIGQSVIVKDRNAIAIEAIEGTDGCIQRAGELCPAGEFTVVKVAKPQQDMRFDVPTVGLGTLQSMAAAGGRTLAIEAGRTIVLNAREVREFADQHGLIVIALEPHEAA